MLTLEIDETSGEPNFIEILEIYYNGNTKEIYFVGGLLENKFFDPHVNAYCVEKTNFIKYASPDSIAFLKPNNLTMLPPYSWWYITVRDLLY